jgi:hypothetical protein
MVPQHHHACLRSKLDVDRQTQMILQISSSQVPESLERFELKVSQPTSRSSKSLEKDDPFVAPGILLIKICLSN